MASRSDSITNGVSIDGLAHENDIRTTIQATPLLEPQKTVAINAVDYIDAYKTNAATKILDWWQITYAQKGRVGGSELLDALTAVRLYTERYLQDPTVAQSFLSGQPTYRRIPHPTLTSLLSSLQRRYDRIVQE